MLVRSPGSADLKQASAGRSAHIYVTISNPANTSAEWLINR